MSIADNNKAIIDDLMADFPDIDRAGEKITNGEHGLSEVSISTLSGKREIILRNDHMAEDIKRCREYLDKVNKYEDAVLKVADVDYDTCVGFIKRFRIGNLDCRDNETVEIRDYDENTDGIPLTVEQLNVEADAHIAVANRIFKSWNLKSNDIPMPVDSDCEATGNNSEKELGE